jgi:hypothetical protein
MFVDPSFLAARRLTLTLTLSLGGRGNQAPSALEGEGWDEAAVRRKNETR